MKYLRLCVNSLLLIKILIRRKALEIRAFRRIRGKNNYNNNRTDYSFANADTKIYIDDELADTTGAFVKSGELMVPLANIINGDILRNHQFMSSPSIIICAGLLKGCSYEERYAQYLNLLGF